MAWGAVLSFHESRKEDEMKDASTKEDVQMRYKPQNLTSEATLKPYNL